MSPKPHVDQHGWYYDTGFSGYHGDRYPCTVKDVQQNGRIVVVRDVRVTRWAYKADPYQPKWVAEGFEEDPLGKRRVFTRRKSYIELSDGQRQLCIQYKEQNNLRGGGFALLLYGSWDAQRIKSLGGYWSRDEPDEPLR
jgi:hypothetical protein